MNDLLKEGQDALVQDEKKKKLEVVKSLKMFGSSITHEMRTPLSTISMICRLINSELSTDDFNKAKILDRIAKINSEVKYLFVVADIVNERLRDIEEMKPFEKLSIKDVIDNFLNEYRFSNLDKNLEAVFMILV